MSAAGHADTPNPLDVLREALRAFRNVSLFHGYPESIPDDALAALAAVETLVKVASAFAEAVGDEWVRHADPSDPDEAVPPWQEISLLGELCRAAAPFVSGKESGQP